MMTKKKVLVISDDPKLVGFLSHGLAECAYSVKNSDNIMGEDLEVVLDRELPDLVIMDIVMPGMDGIELCLRIRQWCPAPIIMLSTWGASKDKVRGLDLSSDYYLTEPFDVAELIARIERTFHQN